MVALRFTTRTPLPTTAARSTNGAAASAGSRAPRCRSTDRTAASEVAQPVVERAPTTRADAAMPAVSRDFIFSSKSMSHESEGHRKAVTRDASSEEEDPIYRKKRNPWPEGRPGSPRSFATSTHRFVDRPLCWLRRRSIVNGTICVQCRRTSELTESKRFELFSAEVNSFLPQRGKWIDARRAARRQIVRDGRHREKRHDDRAQGQRIARRYTVQQSRRQSRREQCDDQSRKHSRAGDSQAVTDDRPRDA